MWHVLVIMHDCCKLQFRITAHPVHHRRSATSLVQYLGQVVQYLGQVVQYLGQVIQDLGQVVLYQADRRNRTQEPGQGRSSWKYLSLNFDLSQILSQSYHSDWWLKSKLRLKYFQELQPRSHISHCMSLAVGCKLWDTPVAGLHWVKCSHYIKLFSIVFWMLQPVHCTKYIKSPRIAILDWKVFIIHVHVHSPWLVVMWKDFKTSFDDRSCNTKKWPT